MIMLLESGGRKCQSVFTEAHYSCFETRKLSPGEQIAAAANEQSVLHGGPFFLFFFSETLL